MFTADSLGHRVTVDLCFLLSKYVSPALLLCCLVHETRMNTLELQCGSVFQSHSSTSQEPNTWCKINPINWVLEKSSNMCQESEEFHKTELFRTLPQNFYIFKVKPYLYSVAFLKKSFNRNQISKFLQLLVLMNTAWYWCSLVIYL